MSKFKITIEDENGNIVMTKTASASQSRLDYYKERTDVFKSIPDIALYNAAVEYCPYDCDHCHD